MGNRNSVVTTSLTLENPNVFFSGDNSIKYVYGPSLISTVLLLTLGLTSFRTPEVSLDVVGSQSRFYRERISLPVEGGRVSVTMDTLNVFRQHVCAYVRHRETGNLIPSFQTHVTECEH